MERNTLQQDRDQVHQRIAALEQELAASKASAADLQRELAAAKSRVTELQAELEQERQPSPPRAMSPTRRAQLDELAGLQSRVAELKAVEADKQSLHKVCASCWLSFSLNVNVETG